MNTRITLNNNRTRSKAIGNGLISLPILSLIAISIICLAVDQDSALVYTIFIACSLAIGWLLNKFNNKPRICFVLLLALVVYLTAFIGLRDFGVGTDTLVYVDSYWDWGKYIHNVTDFTGFDYADKGYLLLSVIGHLLSDDHQIMLILTALVINLFTFLAVYIANYKQLRINWVIYIFIWQLMFMSVSMNAMRQTCAQAIALCSLVLFSKNKKLLGLLLIFIAYNFHSSLIALIPLLGYYLLDKHFSHRNRNIYTGIGLALLLLIVFGIFKYLQDFINLGLINGHFDVYTDNSTFNGENLFGVSYITMTIIYLYLIYYLRKQNLITNSVSYMLAMIYITSFIFRIASYSLVYLSRLADYYVYIVYFALAYLLTKFSKTIPLWIQIMIYVIVLYTWFMGPILGSTNDTYPYHSVILGI